MGRGALSIATGLAVLIMGVMVAFNLNADDEPPREILTPPIIAVTPPTLATANSNPIPGLPGVGPATNRILEWSGNAGPVGDKEMAQLPHAVVAVLVEYGAPLLVPTTTGNLR